MIPGDRRVMDAQALKRKALRLNTLRGIPSRLPAAAAQTRISELRVTMSWDDLSKAAGCSACHLRHIAAGKVPEIKRVTHVKIMSLRPSAGGGIYVNALGTRRRIHALQARSHSLESIAKASSTTTYRISLISHGQPTVRLHMADRIADTYRTLASHEGTSARGRNFAAANGWAPPTAWDDDTIDDPNAIPEWTGHCGTDRGWWIHSAQKIPTCPPCLAAHEQWRQDHAGLAPADWHRAVGQARAEASSREAELAEDGHELMRLGATYETAAARLGITRHHLQQAMRRHPEQNAA